MPKTEFIQNRQELFIQELPHVKGLYDKLESLIEDSMVVPMPETSYDVKNILERGVLLGATSEIKEMEMSRCHSNSIQLFLSNPEEYVVMTGYGYTEEDSMWRQHTWVKRVSDDAIIETTVPREHYFGYELTIEETVIFGELVS